MNTIAVDFDGVIHTYDRGWHDGTIYGDEIPGAFAGLRTLLERHAVFIFTARQPEQVALWLAARGGFAVRLDGPELVFWNEPDVLLVTNRKLPALVYLDDRAVRFESWPQALDDVHVAASKVVTE